MLSRIAQFQMVIRRLSELRPKVPGLGGPIHILRELQASEDRLWIIRPKVMPEYSDEFAILMARDEEDAYSKIDTDMFVYAGPFESFVFEDITDKGYYYIR